jgi:ribosomal protein S18 acetylase RimI-like enzyme
MMAADPITIRMAVATDVPVLHRAIRAIAEHTGKKSEVTSTEADLLRFGFGDRPAFEAIIAEVDDAFAGMCLFFSVFSTWLGRPGVYVQDLYVADEFRSFGVGERLLRHVAGLSNAEGGAYMRLSVNAENRRAQGFYSRLGLVLSSDEQSFIARGASFEALSGTGSIPRKSEERL